MTNLWTKLYPWKLLLLASLWVITGWAQTDTRAGAQDTPGDGAPATETNLLAGEQTRVAERFRRLESVFLRSAEIEALSNPGRAELLKQAAELAKKLQLTASLTRAAASLGKSQYSQAVEDQKTSLANLNQILELLQSENRQDRIRENQNQVKRWIEEADRLLRLQSSLRGRTEGGVQAEKAAGDQQKLANKAGEIAKELNPQEQPSSSDNPNQSEDSLSKDGQPKDGASKDGQSKEGASKDGQSQDRQSQDGQSKDGEPKDGQAKDEQSKEGQSQDGDSKDAKSKDGQSKGGESKGGESKGGESKESQSKDAQQQDAQQQDGQQQDGQQQDGQQQDGRQQKQQPKSPTERAAERIKQAQRRMQEAQESLEKAEREGAVEKQRLAEQELQQAIEELEEILRQLREEEVERSLAALEERLRSMLRMENKLLDDTKRLQEIAGGGIDRQVEIRAGSLANDQRKVLNEGQRALLLLREEGTSAAFPEAMTLMIDDMQTVADRLAKVDIGPLTLAIEQDIVTSLEEMIQALTEIQKDKKERKQQPQVPGQQQPGQPGEQPLVDQLAEVKLIKTLQVRINKRTQTLAEALKDPNDVIGQAEAEEILGQLRQLAERQASIKQVTRDIATGKNQQ